jgi:hypothetical protein
VSKYRPLAWSRDPGYADDLSASAYCQIEGCLGKGPCPRCGETNYHLMGFYGAVARWAKVWGVTEDEAEKRITDHQRLLGEKELAKMQATGGPVLEVKYE